VLHFLRSRAGARISRLSWEKQKNKSGESPVGLVCLPSEKAIFNDDRDGQLEQDDSKEQCQVAAKKEARQQRDHGVCYI
jgi:hypothetical protein